MARPTPRLLAALLVAVLTAPPAAESFAQSELVVVKKGEKEFHRPGCPEIKDAKDVLALSIAQARGRGLKQHDGCDPAKTPVGGSQDPAPIIVYVDSSKYYHKKDCKKLGKDAKKAELEEAGRKLWPCPVCRPPIRKPKGPGQGSTGPNPEYRSTTAHQQQRNQHDRDRNHRGPDRELADRCGHTCAPRPVA